MNKRGGGGSVGDRLHGIARQQELRKEQKRHIRCAAAACRRTALRCCAIDAETCMCGSDKNPALSTITSCLPCDAAALIAKSLSQEPCAVRWACNAGLVLEIQRKSSLQ